jgi:hypothetical protein
MLKKTCPTARDRKIAAGEPVFTSQNRGKAQSAVSAAPAR